MSWIKSMIAKVIGKDEVPRPPKVFKNLAQDFHLHYPQATVRDWIKLFTRGCEEAWLDGYRLGVETKLLGTVDLPPDESVDWVESTLVDWDSIVPIQEGPSMQDVMFTDERGLVIREED